MPHPTDRIVHTTAFVENWLEREIVQWDHRTISGRSTTELGLAAS